MKYKSKDFSGVLFGRSTIFHIKRAKLFYLSDRGVFEVLKHPLVAKVLEFATREEIDFIRVEKLVIQVIYRITKEKMFYVV